jgi:hypothetical protein
MSVTVYSVCADLCVGSGLAKYQSPIKGILPTVYRIKKLKKGPRLIKGLYSQNNDDNNNQVKAN